MQAGTKYIVETNRKQFLDGSKYKNQRGYYVNDSGSRSNVRISVGPTLNQYSVTGSYWVYITVMKTIQTKREVFVTYGKK